MTLDVFGDILIPDGQEIALASWRDGWTYTPPPNMVEWADANRKLPSESSAEAGQWRTDRMPFLRQIMMDCSIQEPHEEIVFRKSTQVGGTEIVINMIGYTTEVAPGPGMCVQPTVDVARRFSEQRLRPMIKLMPKLQRLFGNERSRDSGNTTLLKTFPGGLWVFGGANSANSLASMPIRYLLLDERAKYPRELDRQGSAAEQAKRRTSSYGRRKKILEVSSPTVKDDCEIDAAFERGTQFSYHVPCPFCGHRHRLDIDNLTDDGMFLCPACGELIGEEHKTAMLREATDSYPEGARWVAKFPDRPVRSYEIWAAYASVGLGYTWQQIADMRKEARADSTKEVTFYNTILGQSYEGAAQRVEARDIRDRAGEWLRRTVPTGCLLITVGIDVGKSYFAIGVWGWGRSEQCWAIDYVQLPGDPTRVEDWAVVDEYLAKPFVNSFGVSMRPSAICVDSGNWTNDVYRWARPRQAHGVMAIKGMNTTDAPAMARAQKQDANRRGGVDKRGLQRWNVGGHTIKKTLMQRLINDGDLEEEKRRFHFPADHEATFYQELTAERLDTVADRWVRPKGKANEALDTLVYGYAAALSPRVRLHVMREADWSVLEAKLEPGTGDLWAVPPLAAEPPSTKPAPSEDAAQSSVPIAPASEAQEMLVAVAPLLPARSAPARRPSPFARRT